MALCTRSVSGASRGVLEVTLRCSSSPSGGDLCSLMVPNPFLRWDHPSWVWAAGETPPPRLLFPSPSPKKSRAELGRRCAVASPIASHDPTPSAPSFPHLWVLWEKHISTPWKEASSPLTRFAAAQNPPSPPGGGLTVAESFNLSKSWLLGCASPAS